MTPQWADALRTIITLLLVPGGPIVAWITVRHAHKTDDVPKEQIQEAQATSMLSDTGLAARWQAYADGIEERFKKKFAEQDARMDEQDRKFAQLKSRNEHIEGLLDVYGVYSATLRAWISERKPPPPPPWPPAIDPVTGWDYGDHITPHANQED